MTAIEADFMDQMGSLSGWLGGWEFDRVVMNPPFSGGQDVEHVTKAFGMLRPGGRLVAVMSSSVTFRQGAKWDAFRNLTTDCTVERLPPGSFRESGTNVETVIVVLQKPEEGGAL